MTVSSRLMNKLTSPPRMVGQDLEGFNEEEEEEEEEIYNNRESAGQGAVSPPAPSQEDIVKDDLERLLGNQNHNSEVSNNMNNSQRRPQRPESTDLST